MIPGREAEIRELLSTVYGTPKAAAIAPNPGRDETKAEFMAGCLNSLDGDLWVVTGADAWDEDGAEYLVYAITGDGELAPFYAHFFAQADVMVAELLQALDAERVTVARLRYVAEAARLAMAEESREAFIELDEALAALEATDA
jgi:hypothetical protein